MFAFEFDEQVSWQQELFLLSQT